MWLSSTRTHHWIVYGIAFAAIGSVLLFVVHAATVTSVTLAPQSGTVTGNAAIVSNSTAIGGKALKFGITGSGSVNTKKPPTTNTTSCGSSTVSTASPSGSSYGTNALSQWNCALTSRASQTVTWVAWGDSITEGQGSSTVAGRWANQTLTALRSKYPVSGVSGGFGYIPAFYGTYGPDSQWSTDPTLSGSASDNIAKDDGDDGQEFGDGAGLGMLTVTLKTGGSETFKVTGSSIDIRYNYGSGTFSYKVDSGSATNVATTGGSGVTGSKHVAFSSASSHTVTISGVSGSVVLEGLMAYNGDESKGIRLYDGAQTGTTSGDFVAQATNLAAITASAKADLVTIELGPNDYGRDGGTPSQLTANLQTMVKDIRSAATGHEPSIVIVLVYPNNAGSNSLGYAWSSYESATKAVVSDDPSLGLLNMSSFATAGTSSPYLSSTDDLHPNNAGQTRFAGMVESYLEDK